MRVLVIAALCGLTLTAASARAADPVIVSQQLQGPVDALHGQLVYPLKRKKGEPFVCMRRVGGKVLRAHFEDCGAGRLGLDGRGRVIYVYPVYGPNSAAPTRWETYDVKSDRTRRVKGLPGEGCIVGYLAIWRERIAYNARCPHPGQSGVWLKEGEKKTRIVAKGAFVDSLVLRGDTLVGTNGGEGDFDVYLLAVDGQRCVRRIEGSHGNTENEEVAGLWIANGNVVWPRGYFPGFPQQAPFGLFTSKIPSQCGTPGPNGTYDFAPETADLQGFTLDGRQLYYADRTSIRRHTLPAKPSYAPPANDDFENAQSLTVGAASPGRTAWATVQPGEPLVGVKQTIWYSVTPAKSGTLYASARRLYASSGQIGVYTGAGLATLTPVGTSTGPGGDIRFDAVAGQQYWIDVGTSDQQANYQPIYTTVTPNAP